MSQPNEYKWYWIGRPYNPKDRGWVHGGPCRMAALLGGLESEPEHQPEKWQPVDCVICGKQEHNASQ